MGPCGGDHLCGSAHWGGSSGSEFAASTGGDQALWGLTRKRAEQNMGTSEVFNSPTTINICAELLYIAAQVYPCIHIYIYICIYVHTRSSFRTSVLCKILTLEDSPRLPARFDRTHWTHSCDSWHKSPYSTYASSMMEHMTAGIQMGCLIHSGSADRVSFRGLGLQIVDETCLTLPGQALIEAKTWRWWKH